MVPTLTQLGFSRDEIHYLYVVSAIPVGITAVVFLFLCLSGTFRKRDPKPGKEFLKRRE